MTSFVMNERKNSNPAEGAGIEKEQTISFEKVRRAVEGGVNRMMGEILKGTSESPVDLLVDLQQKACEQGIRPGDVQLGVTEMSGEDGSTTVTVSQFPEKSNKQIRLERSAPDGLRVVLASALLMGACNREKISNDKNSGPEDTAAYDTGDTSRIDTGDTGETSDTGETGDTNDTGTDTSDTSDTGEVEQHDPSEIIASDVGGIECDLAPYFDPNTEYIPPEQVADIHPPDCGVKPDHAPEECGQQQWLGYSEYNPAAVAWMAVANTGTDGCTVTITRLELSYTSTADEKKLLSCGINGVQLLSDGTGSDGDYWGKYLMIIEPGTKFYIPPNTGAYVHQFGDMILVPDDAKELTVTFSAEITEGCVVAGGLDTYSEFANPDTVEGYTQDGSVTDFIKEGMKTPFVNSTIDPEKPISYSIMHVPTEPGTDTGDTGESGDTGI